MNIIVATACLHNFARRRNDPLPEAVEDDDEVPEQANRIETNLRGNAFRQSFIRHHFQ